MDSERICNPDSPDTPGHSQNFNERDDFAKVSIRHQQFAVVCSLSMAKQLPLLNTAVDSLLPNVRILVLGNGGLEPPASRNANSHGLSNIGGDCSLMGAVPRACGHSTNGRISINSTSLNARRRGNSVRSEARTAVAQPRPKSSTIKTVLRNALFKNQIHYLQCQRLRGKLRGHASDSGDAE